MFPTVSVTVSDLSLYINCFWQCWHKLYYPYFKFSYASIITDHNGKSNCKLSKKLTKLHVIDKIHYVCASYSDTIQRKISGCVILFDIALPYGSLLSTVLVTVSDVSVTVSDVSRIIYDVSATVFDVSVMFPTCRYYCFQCSVGNCC